jgi:hypothetical protein
MPREPRLGAEGGADADAEMEVDNLAAARRGLLWLDGARAAWGREGDGACLPYPHYPHGSRVPLRLDREGECPGTVAFISCL